MVDDLAQSQSPRHPYAARILLDKSEQQHISSVKRIGKIWMTTSHFDVDDIAFKRHAQHSTFAHMYISLHIMYIEQ